MRLPSLSLRLTGTGLAATGVAVAGFALARLLASRSLSLAVLALAFVVALAAVSTRRRVDVEVVREGLPARLVAGQSVEIDLVVTALRRTGEVLVEETLPAALGKAPALRLPGLARGDSIRQPYRLEARRRGAYLVGPVVAVTGDPFGFSLRRQPLSAAAEILVHPAVERVVGRPFARRWEDPPVRPPKSRPAPSGFDFYGMREYVPGDDLRRIVWRAYARTGELLVREAEQGVTDRLVLVLDLDAKAVTRVGDDDTFETAVRIAASLGAQALSEGGSVTVLAGGRTLLDRARGPVGRLPLLDALTQVQPSPDAGLRPARAALLEHARAGAHLVLCAATLSHDDAALLGLAVEAGASVLFAQCLGPEADEHAASRALVVGAEVVQVPLGAPLVAALTPTGIR